MRYPVVGTLGGPGGVTCSAAATASWGRAEVVRLYPSFEEAACDTKAGRISGFVVPCAYPSLGSFIMDSRLLAQDTFIQRIPDLVLVGRNSPEMPRANVLFHHRATLPLLPEIKIPFDESRVVSSNIEACERLHEFTDAIAITNSLCASSFGLTVYATLRVGIRMPFVLFCRRTGDETLVR